MYAGHFAAGLALKGTVPEAPTWGILLGVGVLDILFGPFLLIGIEQVTLTPAQSPGFSLDHIDWSHSLLSSAVLSVVFGLLFLRLGGKIMLVMGVAVFSHFILDLVMHPADLALWPGSDVHLGIGLSLSANVRETRSTQRIRVGRRQRKRTCWDCEREWKRMVVPLEPGRPSEARRNLSTTMGHSTGLIREQCPVW